MNGPAVLRALKGAPLAVMIALLLEECPVPAGESWLAMAAGYSRKTTRQALAVLESMEIAQRSGRYNAWRLDSGWHQLPLSWPRIDEDGKGKLYPSRATTTAIEVEGHLIEAAAVVEEVKRSTELSTTVDALRKHGVGDPVRSELAGREWIDAAYVEAMFAAGQGDPIPLVIHRMRSADLPPEVKEWVSYVCSECSVSPCQC